MPVETELRFTIRDHRFNPAVQALNTESGLGRFVLQTRGTRVHADTYFDCNEWLVARGWSLRVRQRNDDVRLTLKRPVAGNSDHGVSHEEIENPKDGKFSDVLENVVSILNSSGAVNVDISAVRAKLALSGVYAALRLSGLRDLFTVETTRHVWDAVLDNVHVAEVVLDDSQYRINSVDDLEPIHEYRMEVELLDASNGHLLGEVAQCIRSRFNFDEVHDSKFDRGMVYYSTRKLRDKMEAKITVTELDDYKSIISYIDNRSDFVRDYQFTKLGYRKITDVYYDNAGCNLFQAGCYLRLRDEGKHREITFRRLTMDVKYGQVLQQEVVASGEGESFNRSWRLIMDWLGRTAGVAALDGATDLLNIEAALRALGLRRVLEIDIVRLPWLVSRIDQQRKWRSESTNHVAKVKYDHITYRRPGDAQNILRDVEFEVAGVEDESAGLKEAQISAYETFLGQFVEACIHASSDGKAIKRISAKYFHGMLGLGIVGEAPEWLADGRLAVSLSLLRESSSDGPSALAQQRSIGQQLAVTEDAIALTGDVASIREELRQGQHLQPQRIRDIDSRLARVEESIARLASGINVTVIQNVAQNTELDFSVLVAELDRMLLHIDPDDTRTRSDVIAARDAAKRGDSTSVYKHLRALGKRALEIAQDVGAMVAAAIIASKLGA